MRLTSCCKQTNKNVYKYFIAFQRNAGHKHESAYSVLKDAISGITMHALKVASYKVYDRFAKDKGFRDNALSPCVLTTINPALPPEHPDLVKVWWQPEEGADYLKFLRRGL